MSSPHLDSSQTTQPTTVDNQKAFLNFYVGTIYILVCLYS